MKLPRIQVDLRGTRPSAQSSGNVLRSGELTALLGLDQHEVPAGHPAIDRCIPLSAGRWAVGRRYGSECTTWRLVEARGLPSFGYPGLLWSDERWFDPRTHPDVDLPPPTPQTLRDQWVRAQAVGGNPRRCIKSLATLVARIRERRHGGEDEPPIALHVASRTAHAPDHPLRWFTLALCACLPPGLWGTLRIGIGEPLPDPEHFDLVVTTTMPRGFRIVDAASPAGEGEDLPAYFVRNRLLADDPEAVEAVTRLVTGRGKDPWGDTVAAQLREPIPGVSTVTDDLLERNPESAIRAITARLQAGADADDEVLEQLVKVTLATRDARPWMPLLTRPAVERARSVQALLEHADALRPKQELVRVLGLIYPRGADVNRWVDALLGWIRAGRSSRQCAEALEQTLLQWPSSAIKTSRASLWPVVIQALVEREEYDTACSAAVGPLSREMCKGGSSDAVITGWMAIPVAHRSHAHLAQLVDALLLSALGELAVVKLFGLLSDDPRAAALLVTEWCRHFGTYRPDDPLFRVIRDTESIQSWIEAAHANGTPQHIRQMLADTPTHDPVWIHAEAAQSEVLRNPRSRFIAIGHLHPGRHALEAIALGALDAALEATSFPDPELGEVARLFIDVPGGSRVWPWITITAAHPGQFDDATIDATVVAFCEAPPEREAERTLASDGARLLGAANEWQPFDHARWIVRLTMAPDAGVGLNNELEVALIHGIAARRNTRHHMEAIHDALSGLEHGHPSRLRYLNALLPIWQSLVG